MSSSPSSRARESASRRAFLKLSAAGAATLAGLAVADAAVQPPAKPGRKIKLGVIGCGSRGQWVSKYFQQHGGFEFHAACDYFPEVVEQFGNSFGVDKSRRFSGLSGYKRLIDSGVEAVAIENLPYFLPEHAKAAVEAGRHVYIAKPVAVDVPGVLTFEAAGKLATQKKQCFLVDYQMTTDPVNVEIAKRIRPPRQSRRACITACGSATSRFAATVAWPSTSIRSTR